MERTMRGHIHAPLRYGDHVLLKRDPRHRGRVEAAQYKVKVRWDDSGYWSEHRFEELEKVQ